MNAPVVDPLQGDFPEVIEEYLHRGITKCISLNRRGTLLAAGCHDGSCVIWDFETRGIAKVLHDKDCMASITSISWSKYGHQILASASDKSLTLWDVVSGEKIAHTTLQQTTLHARLHPGSGNASLCLACPFSSEPMLVDLTTGNTTILPVSVSNAGPGTVPQLRNRLADGSPLSTPTAACFNRNGDIIYVGNSKGDILIIDFKNLNVCGMVPICGGPVIKNIIFSRDGRFLLTNSNDRTIRVYENLLPQKGGPKTLDDLNTSVGEQLHVTEKLKAVGAKCLLLLREFQDSVNRVYWKAACFGGDEWVVGASASKGEHKIYIWDRAGHLVKMLEGPKEALTDVVWHPARPIILSVSFTGLVYIWAKDYTENWSAFAPDFKELEENEEYVEKEDEFDLMPETLKVKELIVKEDEEVDIVTVEKNSAFSDSDASQEELCFLPSIPSPDVPMQEEIFYGGSTKLEDSPCSGSPLPVETGQNEQEIKSSSPIEARCNSIPEDVGTNGKRKRKPSKKGLELQAEKDRKPLTKIRSSGKLSKTESSMGQDNIQVV